MRKERVMASMWKSSAFFFLTNLCLTWQKSSFETGLTNVTQVADQYWGPGLPRPDSIEVRPFRIDVSDEELLYLNTRLDNWRWSAPGFQGVGWNYGVPLESMRKIREYWRFSYNWQERQELLNQYPQFTTEIQGLNIHFYHVKPLLFNRNVRVLPLLLVHGWPGSVTEFQKVIPLLTTPRDDLDFVFEVIVPSLPGFGFSSAAARPGLGPAQMAEVLKNLMLKLGFGRFYTQGGDAGGIITNGIAALYPQHVIGTHSNFCLVGPSLLLIGAPGWLESLTPFGDIFPKLYSMFNQFTFLIQEFGYAYLQATKPDTIGIALSDSPTGLAAYILEKFSTWTNMQYKFLDDGGITLKFTLDELLDNVMLYWISGSITTSMRLYAEQFNSANLKLQLESIPIVVPSGCAAYPNELITLPEIILWQRYKNLIHVSNPPRGGHFVALEEPEIFADDFLEFVRKSEALIL